MIEIVIKIDEKYKTLLDNGEADGNVRKSILLAVVNGTPLPKGHGRLIDADALINSLGASDRDIYCKAVIEEDAPTIIEADKEGDSNAKLD